MQTCGHLAECNDPLLGANAASSDHDKVQVDLAVVWEATHGGYCLLGLVIVRRGVVPHNLAKLGVRALQDQQGPG